MADVNERKKILADEKAFTNFVKQEAGNASVLTAARANKIESSDRVQILAQRSIDNIVREVYLNQLVTSKIPVIFRPINRCRNIMSKTRTDLSSMSAYMSGKYFYLSAKI